jgi:ABC-type transport system substrate-binding protein
VRFDKYFDPANAGWFDAIRWRAVPEDAGFQAVLNGELDFFWKMATDDYFGASTQQPSFTDRCYKGYFYTGDYWYVGWNLRRPALADTRVRRALAMLCDFDAFKRTFYRGLAFQVTGSGSIYGPGYDKDVARSRSIPRKPRPCSTRRAGRPRRTASARRTARRSRSRSSSTRTTRRRAAS